MAKKKSVTPSPPEPETLFNLDPLPELKLAKGDVRTFVLTNPDPIVLKKRLITSTKELALITSLVLFSCYIRLFQLSSPNSVVFDEVHFGGFAKKYILGNFFMDVHPPLAKMLFAAIGLMGGFKGDFDFKSIGDVYPESTPYVFMRAFPAILGVATTILFYFTLKNSGVRPIVAFITACCFVVENAHVTISKYILLDSPLLFFIAAAIYAFKKFEIQIPFSFGWYRSLIATGIALGLAVSSKWVGLFTIAWVGICCVFHLWFIVGDLTVSSKKILGHFFARGLILLGIPAVIYLFAFDVHFKLLANEGDGSAFMSSAFRSTLNGNNIPRDIVGNIGFGSTVTIRHLNTNGGYLHSHSSFYPAGSKQQQITLYPHLDTNNNWIIEPYNETMPDHFVPITDGTKIRLVHPNTGRRLHSHDVKPPVSERDWQKEVSCYGFDGFEGDANDDWVVEIVDHQSAKGEAQKTVKALHTVFKLKHAMTGHYLFSSEVKLPDWGFEQQEVSAASQGYRPLTYWYIETNTNDLLDPSEREIVNYPKLSLWDKVVESHKTMWKINQGLTDHHNWQSSPTSWPLLLRGINYWVRDHSQVYLIGNAVVWWTSSVAIVVFGIHAIFTILKWQSGQPVTFNKHVFNFDSQMVLYLLGWLLHYAPFYIMGRQLFLHHYLPAGYFATLAMGHVFDIFVNYLIASNKLIQKLGYGVLTLFFLLSLVFYANYSSLVSGSPWTKQQCLSSKVLSTWDFECNSFLNTIGEYADLRASAAESAVAEPIENKAEIKEAEATPKVSQAVAKDEANESAFVEPEVQEEEEIVPPAAVDLEETN